MLAKTRPEPLANVVDGVAGAVRAGSDGAWNGRARGPVPPGQPLAGPAGAAPGPSPRSRARDAIAGALKAQAGSRQAVRVSDRSGPDRAPAGDPGGHRSDRSDLPVRNRARPRQRNRAAHARTATADAPKAWTLLTALDELKGHEETVGRARPTGQSYSRDFRGPNWLDLRKSAAAYADSDPAVLVVGAGQAGLSIAARLKQLQVDTLVVDRWPRIGDNWRKRYHALTLHNQVQVNHLPYMNFPPNWPTYIPKDKLAAWFEAYAESMELNVWSGTEFESGAYDEKAGRWIDRAAPGRRHASATMHPRHVIMATGLSGMPVVPDIPTLQNFRGTVLHSTQYEDGEAWKGKRALIIGTGNSGHDIAQDLHSSGAEADAGAAQLDHGGQHRAERAATLCALRRRPAARGLRPHHHVDPAVAGEKEPQAAHRAGAEARPEAARRAGTRGLQAEFRRRRHRLAVQVSDARRRLLLQRRLLRPDRRTARSGWCSIPTSRNSSRKARGCEAARRCPPT